LREPSLKRYDSRVICTAYQQPISDTLRPVERDGLLSNGGPMAMFPKKPYKVGGCTIDLTQTTEGRVCPTTTSQRQAPGYVDTFGDVRWQFQSTHILLVPTKERPGASLTQERRNTPVPCLCEGAGQGAGSLPASTPTTVIRFGSIDLFSLGAEKPEIPDTPALDKERRFHPSPLQGTGLPAPVVKSA
jgi:hypothetical protein